MLYLGARLLLFASNTAGQRSSIRYTVLHLEASDVRTQRLQQIYSTRGIESMIPDEQARRHTGMKVSDPGNPSRKLEFGKHEMEQWHCQWPARVPFGLGRKEACKLLQNAIRPCMTGFLGEYYPRLRTRKSDSCRGKVVGILPGYGRVHCVSRLPQQLSVSASACPAGGLHAG